MSEKPRKLRVFLCHTSADKPKVLELYQRLITEDWIDPWLDAAKILPGQHWTSVIRQSLFEADSVIILISNISINREGFVQREMNYAWDMSLEKPRNVIYLIPLRLEDCEVPFDLRERQWADYFGGKQEETYYALLKALRLRHEQKLRIEAEELSHEEKRQREIETSAREKTERETAEKARLEVEERARQKAEKEKAKRESAETVAREKAEQESAKKAQLEVEEQIRQKAEKEKAEHESVETIAREKVKKEIVEKARRLEIEERIRQKAAKEKAVREVAETKMPLLPIEERLGCTVVTVLVLMIIFIYWGWHTQSLSSAPVATPTLLPPELFVSPLPSVESPMAMIEEFAIQTSVVQTAVANSGILNTPTKKVPAGTVVNPTAVPAGVRPASYTLQNGEFPGCIARRFNVDMDAILSASGLTSPDLYYPGLTLTIPQSGAFPGSRMLTSHPVTYSVLSSEETMYSIACKFGDIDPATIASANSISISAKLTAGQQLQIP